MAKWLRDHRWTLCIEGWQQVFWTIWQLVSQMLLKSHIWWQAHTNQDQSAAFETEPISQPFCLSPVEFHFHFSLFSCSSAFTQSSVCFVIPPLLSLCCCCLDSLSLLLRGNQALLWVFKYWSRRTLNYSQDLIFCLGGENQPPYHMLGNSHAHISATPRRCVCGCAHTHTHTWLVSQSVSQKVVSHTDLMLTELQVPDW